MSYRYPVLRLGVSFVLRVFLFFYLFIFFGVFGVRESSGFILYVELSSSPAPLSEVTLPSLLNSLASYVMDGLSIGAWVYFWAFCSVPLICMSFLGGSVCAIPFW